MQTDQFESYCSSPAAGQNVDIVIPDSLLDHKVSLVGPVVYEDVHQSSQEGSAAHHCRVQSAASQQPTLVGEPAEGGRGIKLSHLGPKGT